MRIPKLSFRILLFSFFSVSAFAQAQQEVIQKFPLKNVRLKDGPFKNAEQVDLKYILELDADRLLAPYLKEAGLTPKKTNYTNWENTGLDGHIGGHYLTALSLMYASTGNQEIKQKLDYYISELKRCQDNSPNGYLGGIPNSKELWNDISKGQIEAATFSLNKRWVPLYNIHKIYAGLKDAYTYTDNQTAKQMFIKLCDWMLDEVKDLSDQQIQKILISEHGGLNETFADAYEITKDKKYLQLAQKFSHLIILNPLLKNEDKLNGIHANTQIPKVIGYKKIADLTGNNSWDNASKYFWDNVVYKRSVAIGGNSVREHFHPTNDFSSMITDVQGPETCNTYNMLKLSELLYATTGDTKYLEYEEKALFNHILASQHPEKGGFVYFTPMRPNHYRVYSQVHTSMWCCVGSGIENHAKYGDFIYAHQQNDIFINQFIASTLNWKEKGITVDLNTTFPQSDIINLNINTKKKQNFTLKIRKPNWVNTNSIELTINGKAEKAVIHNNYIVINKMWKNMTAISIKLPMALHLEDLPDASNYTSVFYGPVLLAAKTGNTDLTGLYADDSRGGHIANGKLFPITSAPIFLSEKTDILKNIIKKGDINFKVNNVVYPQEYENLELIPFYNLHDARYSIYFKWQNKTDFEKEKFAIAENERLRVEEAEKTIDYVSPGQQQPESDHFFESENSESGVHQNRQWRHANGWFSYQLKNKNKEAKKLRITCFGQDGNRNFDILINNEVLATVNLDGKKGETFFDLEFDIPKKLNTEIMKVKFLAHKNSTAGGIYDVRLLK